MRILKRISFLTVLIVTVGFTLGNASTFVLPKTPTISTLPILNPSVIPVVAGHQWKKSSTSSKTFIRCMIDYGVKSKYNLRVQQYTNDSARSLAFIVFAADLTARAPDVADVLQTCLNGVVDPIELNLGGGPEDGANMGLHKGVRAYATARGYKSESRDMSATGHAWLYNSSTSSACACKEAVCQTAPGVNL